MARKCNFCGEAESAERRLLADIEGNAYICEYCIAAAYDMIHGDTSVEESKNDEAIEYQKLTPKELKAVLDNYVIGQDRAKKVFSVGVYNHYKRIFKQSDIKDDTEISKSNILLVGPTGSGKTLMAQTLARFLDVPIAICDATSLTEAGYVGEDVENILTRLLQAANGDVKKAEQGIVFVDEIDKIVVCGGAFDGLLDIIERRVGKNVLGFNQEKRGKNEKENLLSLLEPDDLVKYGLIPELIGRLHVVATLNEITKEDMVKILTEPKNAILKQYQKLCAIDGATLKFDDEALEEIASLAIERKTGARGLRSIMEELMTDIMYDLPELKDYDIVISKETVKDGAKPILIKHDKKIA